MKKSAVKGYRMIMMQEQMRYLDSDWLQPVQELANKYQGFEYAYILHDKDVDDKGNKVAAHIHLMARFGSSAMTKTLIEWSKLLHVPVSAIQKWQRWKNGLSYLVHETNEAKFKYQYDIAEVCANFDYVAAITKIRRDITIDGMMEANTALDELVLYPMDEIVTRRNEFKDKVKGSQRNSFNQQSKVLISNLLDDVPAKKLVNVVWLWGPTGVGKSKAARELAESWGDYYITGADNDSLQGYQFQKTWILDDMRPSMFNSIGEFLRLLDPYAVSRIAPARYHNINLGLVENIIITSPNLPYEVFNGFAGADEEDETQLERRLTEITRIGQQKIATL